MSGALDPRVRGCLGAAWADRDGDVFVVTPRGRGGYGSAMLAHEGDLEALRACGPWTLLAAALSEEDCEAVARATATHLGADPARSRRRAAARLAEPAARRVSAELRLARRVQAPRA